MDAVELAALWERNRAERLARRPAEAAARGGWIYVVLGGVKPLDVAQRYGGKRPGVLSELAAANPGVAQGETWAGWWNGRGVLLPAHWRDPLLTPRPLPGDMVAQIRASESG